METTQAILDELRKTLTEQYENQLNQFGPHLPKKMKETMLDGFKDGVGNGIRHTVGLLGVTVKGKE